MLSSMTREEASLRDVAETVRWLCKAKVEVREGSTINDEKSPKADIVRRREFQNGMQW